MFLSQPFSHTNTTLLLSFLGLKEITTTHEKTLNFILNASTLLFLKFGQNIVIDKYKIKTLQIKYTQYSPM